MPTHSLSSLTTLRIGGPVDLIDATDDATVIDAVREADGTGVPLLIVGGGSNIVAADDPHPGRALRIRTEGIEVTSRGEGQVEVRVAAGMDWDAVVAETVDSGWAGIESLSGIPGRTGATPIQNVGAYGREVAEVLVSVRAWDRRERRECTLTRDECGFGYRWSRFKEEPGRWVVLDVVLALSTGGQAPAPAYAELRSALGIAPDATVPIAQVRDAVLALRRSKGMVLDGSDHDTWSAGSFFLNPVLNLRHTPLPDDAPRWPQPDGRVKTSAAWLIEHAGFAKGWAPDCVGTPPRASLSTKHTLAVTNRGAATTADVLAVAREVRDGVQERFGITLAPEPVLVGCSLG